MVGARVDFAGLQNQPTLLARDGPHDGHRADIMQGFHGHHDAQRVAAIAQHEELATVAGPGEVGGHTVDPDDGPLERSRVGNAHIGNGGCRQLGRQARHRQAAETQEDRGLHARPNAWQH